MGMFDYIRVEVLLPDRTEVINEQFQTKSFENVMTEYVISENGELYEERWEFEWIEDDGHFLKGYLQKVKESYHRVYLTDYHGDVIFYGNKPKSDRVWRDYYARFTDGGLTRMWYNDNQY